MIGTRRQVRREERMPWRPEDARPMSRKQGREGEEVLQPPAIAQAGTAAPNRPALPPWPALPPKQRRHCRPNRHCRPEHAGTAGPTKVNCISTVDLSSMDQDNLCNSDFTPVRIWVYKYLTPSSRSSSSSLQATHGKEKLFNKLHAMGFILKHS